MDAEKYFNPPDDTDMRETKEMNMEGHEHRARADVEHAVDVIVETIGVHASVPKVNDWLLEILSKPRCQACRAEMGALLQRWAFHLYELNEPEDAMQYEELGRWVAGEPPLISTSSTKGSEWIEKELQRIARQRAADAEALPF